ncbi:MAG: hypothetical protein WD875_19690 [Pirellulales bacterium]
MSEHLPIVDAATLDRMVDGELDRQAEGELFARLDDETDGWRRLALAFVESQALGAELRGVVAASRLKGESAVTSVTGHRETSGRAAPYPWSRVLSLAASLLICVGIGFGVGRAWHGRTAGHDVGATGATNIVEADIVPSVGGATVGDSTADITKAVAQEDAPLGMFTLPTHGGTPVQLPIYDVANGGQQMLTSTESAVPAEVIHALRSRGHEVKQQRRLWPIDLGDGRRIIVPVEQVDVKYVGTKAYQ